MVNVNKTGVPFSESGSGTSKKLAKRNAAAKMLARIHDVPVDLRTSNDGDAEEDTFNTVRDFKHVIYVLRRCTMNQSFVVTCCYCCLYSFSLVAFFLLFFFLFWGGGSPNMYYNDGFNTALALGRFPSAGMA